MSAFFSTFTEIGLVDTRLNPGTIVLPKTTEIPYRIITLKDIYGKFATNALTLTTQVGESFEDGTTSKIFRNDGTFISLYAGTATAKWYIMGGTQTLSQTISSLTVSTITGDGGYLRNLNAVSSLTLYSTIQGLGTLGYLSSAGIVYLSSIISTPQLTSSLDGLGSLGYISSTQLISTVQSLGTIGFLSTAVTAITAGLGIGINQSNGIVTITNITAAGALLSTFVTVTASSLIVSSMQISAITATYGSFSTLQVNVLQLGSGTGYINTGDLIATSLSTLQINAGNGVFTNLYVGATSSLNTIQFYGLDGFYRNTAIAELSTGVAGNQELLLFTGSTTTDRIRLQTTGDIRFESGVSSRLFSNTMPGAQPVPAMILDSNSNVGIGLYPSSITSYKLDVAGQIRSLGFSTLQVVASSFQGDGSQLTGIITTGLLISTVNVITGYTTSTTQGLGTLGYISSTGPTQLAVTSTTLGLGTLGYLSSRVFNLQSTFYVNAANLTSVPSYGTFTIKTGFAYTGSPWITQTAQLQTATNSFSQVVLDVDNQTLIYSGSNAQVFRITYTCGGNQNEVAITRPALTMQLTSGGNTKTYQTVNNIESAGASVTNVISLSPNDQIVFLLRGLENYTFATVDSSYYEIIIESISPIPLTSFSSLQASSFSLLDQTTNTFVPFTVSSSIFYINGQLPNIIPLYSTSIGLGSAGYISSQQLISTTQSLTNYINSFIDPVELTSTVVGLGTQGMISTSGLLSTAQGMADYIVTFIDPQELASTVTGLGSAQFISSVGFVTNTTSSLKGLGLMGYVSTTQLTSTTQGLSLLGYVSTTQLTSTTQGLSLLGYISSSQLVSSTQGLGTLGYISSSQLLSTTQSYSQTFTTLSANVSTLTSSNINATNGFVSSLTVNILTFGSGTGYINTGDVIATSMSTIQINAGSAYTANLYVGTNSTFNSLQFYGLDGFYRNTAIAEVSTGVAGNQELLLFTGSTTTDRIRLQTTGDIRFEPGVSSRLFSNTMPGAQVVPAMILDSNSNVGIGLYPSSITNYKLDVAGQIRSQGLSTLQIVASTFQGDGTLLTGIATSINIGSTLQGLGTYGYISTVLVTPSSLQGLGTLGYISSTGPSQLAVTSTTLGLGSLGYLSSRVFNLQSTFFINSQNLISQPSYGTFTIKTGFAYTGAPWTTQTSQLQLGTNSFSQVVLGGDNQTLSYTGSAPQYFRITYTCGGNQNEVAITRPALTMQLTSGGITKTYQTVNNIESAGASVTNVIQLNPNDQIIFLLRGLENYTFATVDTTYYEIIVESLNPLAVTTFSTLAASSLSIIDQTTGIYTTLTLSTNAMYINNIIAGGPIVYSTVTGLGSADYISSTQLTSTTQGLTSYINSFIDPAELTSTVIGLGTQGMISTSGLLSTAQGMADYIVTFIDPQELASTVTGLGSVQFVSTLGYVTNTTSSLKGLGLMGYVSTTQLTSTTQGLSWLGYVSTTQLTSTTQGLSWLGYVSTAHITSTTQGLSLLGYVSSSQLVSSTQGLGTLGYISSSQLLSTTQSYSQTFTTLSANVSTLTSSNINATNGFVSSLTVNILTFGSGTGYINTGDVIATSMSTVQINAGSAYTANLYIGTNSTFNSLQFYGLDGFYRNTAIAEVSTGVAGNQELLLFTGSTTMDRIRLQTTGDIRFEPGVSSRLFSNTMPGAQVVPAMILDSNSNVGIGLYPSSITNYKLDVAGQIRSQGLSTLQIVASTFQGDGTLLTGIATSINIGSTLQGLGTYGYISTVLVTPSSLQGLGTLGYISSTGPSQLAVTSTTLGLGSLGYLSSRVFNLQSTFFINSQNLISQPSYGTFTMKTGFAYSGAPWTTQTAQLQLGTNNFSQVVLGGDNQTLSYTGSAPQYFRITYTCGGNQNEVATARPTLTMQVTTQSGVKTYQTVNNIESAGASVTNVIQLNPTDQIIFLIRGLENYTFATVDTTYYEIIVESLNPLAVTTFSTLGASSLSLIDQTTGLYATIALSTNAIYVNGVIVAAGGPNLYSTVTGLGSAGYVSSTQLISTAQGLTSYIDSFIDPVELTSTVIGLGTQGMISTSGLLSTAQGMADYIVTFIDPQELASTVTGLGSVQFVSTLGYVTNTTSSLKGLGLMGYVSTTQLTSTTQGLSWLGYVSTTQLTSTTQGLSLLGYVSTAHLTSTTQGLSLLGYISSSQLTSTIQALGTLGYISSSQLISTTQSYSQTFTTLSANVSTLTASNINATTGYVSSLNVNILTFASGTGYINTGDVIATSMSTIQINAGSAYTANLYIGTNSTFNSLQFYGLDGFYKNTAIAELSTGVAGNQELLLFTGSTTMDRIRLQTTGDIRFEPGVSSRLFSNTMPGAQTVPAMIIDSNSNVGIGLYPTNYKLDIAGFERNQGLSSLQVVASSFRGDGSQLTGILSLTQIANSLTTLSLNASSIGANVVQSQQVSTLYVTASTFTGRWNDALYYVLQVI